MIPNASRFARASAAVENSTSLAESSKGKPVKAYWRWSVRDTRSLLEDCRKIPVHQRGCLTHTATSLLGLDIWQKSGRTEFGIRHRLDLVGVRPDFSNDDISRLLESSPYAAEKVPVPVHRAQPAQERPAQEKPVTAALLKTPALLPFEYKNAELVFNLKFLSEQTRKHICTMWKEISHDVKNIEERIESFCQFTSYSQDTLRALLTPEAIAFQKRLLRRKSK